ncbi:PAS domain-containing sensor histidine kinase [Paludibaculum fermentans]|uniref:PAS domain-containing sensor histidine kinase n=1 Tax=Paludibaculum fermentans TaxID=1473598 RepID=UPI003EBA228A
MFDIVERKLEAPAEVAKLRRCLNDLVSVIALPGLWTDKDAGEIASTVADALAGILDLSFVLIQLNDADGRPSFEVMRMPGASEKAQDFFEALSSSLGGSAASWPASARIPGSAADLNVATARLGIRGELGTIAVVAERAGFPDQSERLILDVSANQAVVGLQHAFVLGEQRRLASRLEDHVAQGTRELAAANEQLKKSEGNLQLIIDRIPAFVWCMLPDGSNEFISRAWHAHTGVPPEASRGWGWMSVFHPEDLPGLMKKWQEVLSAGKPDETEARIRRHDGAYRWFLIRTEPFRDESGEIVRWYGTSTDIEDRKRAEQALESRGQDLRMVIDTIPTLSWSTDATGSVEFLSRPWLDFTGLSAEQALGFGWAVAIHPDDAAGLLHYWQSALEAGTTVDVEARLRRFDGAYRWFLFRANPFRDETGRIIRWYGTNIEIEDRKRAEEELRRNDAFLTKAQRLSSTGSFSWVVNTDEITFSEEACRIFELDRTTPITLERIAARVHPDDLHLVNERAAAARSTGEGLDYEFRIQMPDGSIKYLQTTSNEAGGVNGNREYIGAIQDVTQRWVAEEALNKARSDLAHVSRIMSLSELTASIAHEVNQPLSGIITNAGTCLRMLNANPPNVDGARETARRTIRDGNRASEVVTRLRALFSRGEFSPEWMDMNEAAREVAALSLGELQRNRVAVQLDLADDLPPIFADRVQLQQVILNLLRNASDAMAGVRDRPRHMLIRTEYEHNGNVRLSVRDAGVGLDAQNLEKLFDSFYTTKEGGMGIGLSVSRSIIEKHHGRLWAEPNDGAGATFCFSIPRGTETNT